MNKEELIKEWEELDYNFAHSNNDILVSFEAISFNKEFIIKVEINENYFKIISTFDGVNTSTVVNKEELELIQKTMDWLNNEENK